VFFCVVFHHNGSDSLLEWELLQFIDSFPNSRRRFIDTRRDGLNLTDYYVEAPEEFGTILKLSGWEVTVIEREPGIFHRLIGKDESSNHNG